MTVICKSPILQAYPILLSLAHLNNVSSCGSLPAPQACCMLVAHGTCVVTRVQEAPHRAAALAVPAGQATNSSRLLVHCCRKLELRFPVASLQGKNQQLLCDRIAGRINLDVTSPSAQCNAQAVGVCLQHANTSWSLLHACACSRRSLLCCTLQQHCANSHAWTCRPVGQRAGDQAACSP